MALPTHYDGRLARVPAGPPKALDKARQEKTAWTAFADIAANADAVTSGRNQGTGRGVVLDLPQAPGGRRRDVSKHIGNRP